MGHSGAKNRRKSYFQPNQSEKNHTSKSCLGSNYFCRLFMLVKYLLWLWVPEVLQRSQSDSSDRTYIREHWSSWRSLLSREATEKGHNWISEGSKDTHSKSKKSFTMVQPLENTVILFSLVMNLEWTFKYDITPWFKSEHVKTNQFLFRILQYFWLHCWVPKCCLPWKRDHLCKFC